MSRKPENVVSQSGRPLEELTMEALLKGELTEADFRISAETLLMQAEAAEDAGYVTQAGNLRRAAELTRVSNEEVLAIYHALRPGRTSYRALVALADRLEDDLDAPLTAALVREAAEVYRARGLVEMGGK
ncbi:MAG: propanediol utilization protein [Anaerolineae bacterium]|nr:propanediol utilization protein [Anaerolineae bacterium]